MPGEITETIIGVRQKAFGGSDAGVLGKIHEVFEQVRLALALL